MSNIIRLEFWEKKGQFFFRKGINVPTALSDENQNSLFEIEANSWWFQYRAGVILEILNTYLDRKKTIVDVGGGNGYNSSRVLEAGYDVALMEPSPQACYNAFKRGITKVYCGTLDNEGICDGSIDAITLLDVLEHIEDDKEFLTTINKKLKPEGKCVITVPAFMQLWSSEDVEAGHFRRYTLKQIEHLGEECGFQIVYSNYFFQFLYMPILAVRVWMEKLGLLKARNQRTSEEQEKIAKAQFEKKKGIVDKVLSLFEKRELRKIRLNKRISYGSSVIIVLEKSC